MPFYIISDRRDLSLLALAVYDTLLTFSRELRCIWSRRFRIVTVLFVLQRYVTIAAAAFVIPGGSHGFELKSEVETVRSLGLPLYAGKVDNVLPQRLDTSALNTHRITRLRKL